MFHLLATTKCKRQQIAILIISFFAYVAGIRNEGNNMLLQQQLLQQQQQTIIENSDNKSSITDIKQQSTFSFRPSPVINFTPADAAIPQQFKPSFIKTPHSTSNDLVKQNSNNNNNMYNNVSQKQETQTSNRRYTIETAATYGNAAEKPFSFPNEQQQTPQHLTDKPIYIYRDPFTNENYHYTPTETNVKETVHNQHNNYNNNAHKQQNLHQHLQHYDDNQEYLVQSSMTVGTHQQQQQKINPFRPDLSLSADKDVYLKRPGFVYDEKPSSNHSDSVIDKKSEVNKISYDSHDYPPPSYFKQHTSNFLPTPVPPTHAAIKRPKTPPTSSPYQRFRPPPYSSMFVQQQPQRQLSQSSQSPLPNYANSIDNYLLNKQQTSEFYRTETPPSSFLQPQSQSQTQHQYDNKPPFLEYNFPQQLTKPSYEHQQRPPSFNFAQTPYPQYESVRPPPGRPSYNNYYDYQIGEIPPQAQTSVQASQHSNYPYPRPPPPPQYPYQGPYRPPTPPPAQPSGLATLAQYAPQFTSLLLGGVGGGGGGNGGAGSSNNNGPLGSLIGALTGAATSQQSSSSLSSSFNRRPVNSQLIKALENIARNDDLQCVPKVVCQMIAAQTQRGQLPTFITSPAITNFLAGFPAASPALIYGRAALLGLSGGVKSCHQTYVNCPKDEYEIINYLNNHRGGFFKFFSEPEEQQQTLNHDSTQQGPTSLFSIVSALTGAPQATTTTQTTTTSRPKPKPQVPTTDITSGIGNFFTQLLSDYVGGAAVEYQRSSQKRTKRSLNDKIKFEGETDESQRHTITFQDDTTETQEEVLKFKDHDFDENEYDDVQQNNEYDFHDEEDEEDTQYRGGFNDNASDYLDSTQSRILQKKMEKGKRIEFFPEMERDEIDIEDKLKDDIKKYNDYNTARKLRFPTVTDDHMNTETLKDVLRQGKILSDDSFPEDQNYGHQFTNYVENSFEDYEHKQHKKEFIYNHDDEDNEKQAQQLYSNYFKDSKSDKTSIIFPERESKILNHPYYATSYLQDYQLEEAQSGQNKKLVLQSLQRPFSYIEHSSSPSVGVYSTQTNSFNTQNSISPNTAVFNNVYVASPPSNTKTHHFLPTPPPPQEYYETNTKLIYSNKDNTNNQKMESIFTKYPSVVYPPTSFNDNNFNKPSQSSLHRYQSSLYTTRRPYASVATTEKSDSKNIYVTNSRGVTEFYIKPDGTKIYL